MKVALLSNVNADFVLRLLSGKFDCVPSSGYGDVWGQLLDPQSSLNSANPDVIIFLIDIEQLTDGTNSGEAVSQWFATFDKVIDSGREYFVSDVMFRSPVLSDNDTLTEYDICRLWINALEERVQSHPNVHPLRVSEAVTRAGKERCFSPKLWYMGKIPYTNEGCRLAAAEIESAITLLSRIPKKVLILDLDNTLWGGILGEAGPEGIALSDDHIGAVYRKVQRMIQAIKDNGTILAIASKNNESDVQEVWCKNPHMLLKKEDFAAIKINWRDKADNIREISRELNLGTDSFVFIDDMPAERDNIRLRIPEVIVPDFPERIEDYPAFIEDVYSKYFKRLRLSSEDRNKTQQYAENTLRENAAKGLSFEDFLMSLGLEVERVSLDDAKLSRIAQMHGKTNQFNLTTIRYTRQDIDRLLREGFRIYAYSVRDKFGDYGLVAAVIVDMSRPEINSFLMSCRVMGKLIENYVIDDVENDLLASGCDILHAKYIKTAKNSPVEKLFDGLGYRITSNNDSETCYEIDLKSRPQRKFFVNMH